MSETEEAMQDRLREGIRHYRAMADELKILAESLKRAQEHYAKAYEAEAQARILAEQLGRKMPFSLPGAPSTVTGTPALPDLLGMVARSIKPN